MSDTPQSMKTSKSAKGRWFVATNSINLLSILARGLIGPRVFLSDYSSDFMGAVENGVLLLQSGFPGSLMQGAELADAMSTPVLVELEKPGTGSLTVRALQQSGESFTTTLRKAGGASAAVFEGVLPVSAIRTIWFPTTEDLEDFQARAFENVPLSKTKFDVDSVLFGIDASITSDAVALLNKSDVKADAAADWARLSETADRYAGGLTVLVSVFPEELGWLRQLGQALLGKAPRGTAELGLGRFVELVRASDDSVSPTESEIGILEAAVRLVTSERFKDGWSGRDFIQAVLDLFEPVRADHQEAERLQRWGEVSLDVLANRRDMVPLDDAKSWVLRAILLLMLRRDPDDLVKVRHSSLAPGSRVVAVAGLLAGLHSGFERLSNDIKCADHLYELVSLWVARSINKDLGQKLPKPVFNAGKVDLLTSETNVMAVRATVKLDGQTLFERHVEASHAIRKAKHVAEELGWKLRFDHERQRLDYQFELPGGRKQKVFIEKGRPSGHGLDMLRFWSPCLDLSLAERRKILNAKEMDSLLQRNVSHSLHCRFGIDRAEKAVVVVVDQIAKTMDAREFEAHMRNVAYAADEYEREKSLDDF